MARRHRRSRRGLSKLSLGGLKSQATTILAAITGVGVGFGSFIDQATMKWKANYDSSTTIDHKFFDAIASFIGNGATNMIANAVGKPWGGASDFHINPWGVFNKHTGGGALLLILDGIAKKGAKSFGVSGAYSAPGKFIRATGSGELFGGIIGGLADDPNPSNYSPGRGQSNLNNGQSTGAITRSVSAGTSGGLNNR